MRRKSIEDDCNMDNELHFVALWHIKAITIWNFIRFYVERNLISDIFYITIFTLDSITNLHKSCTHSIEKKNGELVALVMSICDYFGNEKPQIRCYLVWGRKKSGPFKWINDLLWMWIFCFFLSLTWDGTAVVIAFDSSEFTIHLPIYNDCNGSTQETVTTL